MFGVSSALADAGTRAAGGVRAALSERSTREARRGAIVVLELTLCMGTASGAVSVFGAASKGAGAPGQQMPSCKKSLLRTF